MCPARSGTCPAAVPDCVPRLCLKGHAGHGRGGGIAGGFCTSPAKRADSGPWSMETNARDEETVAANVTACHMSLGSSESRELGSRRLAVSRCRAT